MRYLVITGLMLAIGTLGTSEAREYSTQTTNSEVHQPAGDTSTKVDLNTADQIALESLPGVGPRTAQLILEYRTETGGFKKVEELMNVKGIGEKTFLRLRELVRVEMHKDGR